MNLTLRKILCIIPMFFAIYNFYIGEVTNGILCLILAECCGVNYRLKKMEEK